MPKVSVIIPTKNRSALLAGAIERIESQTVPREQYEVIVIDNDSTDDTRQVLEQKARRYSNLKYGLQGKPGPAATRNAGLRLANAEVVLFVDDDVHATHSLVQAHLECHQRIPNASVIGAVEIPWDNPTRSE